MVLSAIAAGCVQEDNLLTSLTRLLVKDLTLSPQRRFDVDIATDDAVVFRFVLFVFGRRASEGIVQEFQNTTPDVGPASKRILQRTVSESRPVFESLILEL